MPLRLSHLILMISLVLPGVAAAGDFPTAWSVKNTAKRTISLTCTSLAPGVAVETTFGPHQIASGETRNETWGDAYYNDGLGLQAAAWTCTAGFEDQTLLPAGKFKTDWGESLKLIVWEQDGGLRVGKSRTKGSVAEGSPASGAKKKKAIK